MMMTKCMASAWILLTGWIISSSVPARAQNEKGTGGQGESMVPWRDEIDGAGLTVDKAKKDAIDHALDELNKFLRREASNWEATRWEPTREFVENFLIQYPGKPGPDRDLPRGGKAKTWVYRLNPLPLRKIREQDEKARIHRDVSRRADRAAHAREWTLGFSFAAILCCGALLAYLRRKEARR